MPTKSIIKAPRRGLVGTKLMKERLENIGHSIHFPPENYTVRGFRIAVVGVGLVILMSLDSSLLPPPSVPDKGFLPTSTPTSTPTPSPTIRRKILPTPLGPFDSIQDCLRPLITKNSMRCLDDWGTPTP